MTEQTIKTTAKQRRILATPRLVAGDMPASSVMGTSAWRVFPRDPFADRADAHQRARILRSAARTMKHRSASHPNDSRSVWGARSRVAAHRALLSAANRQEQIGNGQLNTWYREITR